MSDSACCVPDWFTAWGEWCHIVRFLLSWCKCMVVSDNMLMLCFLRYVLALPHAPLNAFIWYFIAHIFVICNKLSKTYAVKYHINGRVISINECISST